MTRRGPSAPENAVFSDPAVQDALRSLVDNWASSTFGERCAAANDFVNEALDRGGFEGVTVAAAHITGAGKWEYESNTVLIASDLIAAHDPTHRPESVDSPSGFGNSAVDTIVHETMHVIDDRVAGRNTNPNVSEHADIQVDAQTHVNAALGEPKPSVDGLDSGTSHIGSESLDAQPGPVEAGDASAPTEPGPDTSLPGDSANADGGVDLDAGTFEEPRAGADAPGSAESDQEGSDARDAATEGDRNSAADDGERVGQDAGGSPPVGDAGNVRDDTGGRP